MNQMAIPNSDHPHPKLIEIIEFAPACKISVHLIYSFLKYSQFQSPMTRLAKPIFDHAHPQIFWSTFNLCELVSTYKNQVISLFWRYGWLKNPEIWLAENILVISLEKKISQIWDLCRIAANMRFPYRTNSVKIND